MKRSLLPLLAIVTLAVPAAAQTSTRSAALPASPHVQPAQALPQQTPPAPPQPGICCCRVWSHGWQYAWRPNGDCTAQSGTCVTPDHC